MWKSLILKPKARVSSHTLRHFTPWVTQHPDSFFSVRPGANGFLPVTSPLDVLPDKYAPLEALVSRMMILQPDGSAGLLATGGLGAAVDKELPLLDVSDEEDPATVAGLFRDYCFLASAYSLEPTHVHLMANPGVYGLARTSLPMTVAEPLMQLCKKVGAFPWLDYAYGYGLNNAVLKEGADPTKWDSYKTCRMFNGSASESGFINVHVAMVAQTGELLLHAQSALAAASARDHTALALALNQHHDVFSSIVDCLQTMWTASKPSGYLAFRTFIMGQTGNSLCYPSQTIDIHRADGSLEKHSYRGETGAQDSIVPAVDNLLQLEYPRNKLTEYLWDLRAYRPNDHTAYLNYVAEESKKVNLKEVCYEDPECSVALMRNLDVLRMFRGKHWNLTKAYIIRNTKHPTATGGTPITTWLPNQLGATLEYQGDVISNIKKRGTDLLSPADRETFNRMNVEITDHVQRLMEEVFSLQEDFQGSSSTVSQETGNFAVRTAKSKEGVFKDTHDSFMGVQQK